MPTAASSIAFALTLATCLCAVAQTTTPPQPDQQALDAWHAVVDGKEPTDDAPCQKLVYPSTEWKAVPCLDPRAAKRLGHPVPRLGLPHSPPLVPSAAASG